MTTAPAPIRKAGRRGKRPAIPLTGVGPIEYYSVGVPPKPPTETRTPAAVWGLDGNDKWGDCVVAGADHSTAAWNTEAHEPDTAAGTAAWHRDSGAGCVAEYKLLTGATEPGDADDTGLVISDFLGTWQTDGLTAMGVEPVATFGPVDTTSLLAVHRTTAYWGATITGANLPDSAEEQFEAGKPWTYVGDAGTGGHCFVVVGYSPEWLVGITWGEPVLISWAWWEAYVDEAYAAVPPEFVAAKRGRFEIATAALMADVTAALALRRRAA